ncbi:unnamed protein product [Brassica oleracea]
MVILPGKKSYNTKCVLTKIDRISQYSILKGLCEFGDWVVGSGLRPYSLPLGPEPACVCTG